MPRSLRETEGGSGNMLNIVFETIFHRGAMTAEAFLIATLCSFLSGIIIAGTYMVKRAYSQSFVLSLVIIPCIVQMIIMLVNGNVGTGVAVAGAFGLVRFRSAQGRGEEITSIFLAMAAGLATGMGYIFVAILFSILVSFAELMLRMFNFGGESKTRKLRITIPEDLDYEGRFDDIFKSYLKKYELTQVKTCNMGTMYRLDYDVIVNQSEDIKEFMDKLRERNGNLEIMLNRCENRQDEL